LTLRTTPTQINEVTASGKPEPGQLWTGFVVGFALILMNPAALITWVVIVGSFLVDGTHSQGTAAAIGIGIGSFAWFSTVAYLADKGKRVLGEKAVWVTRIVAILLVLGGLFSFGRAAWYVLDAMRAG